MTHRAGAIHQLNRSHGGVPKLPVARARVGSGGLEGDRQRDLRYHGGPLRALCLYSLELIRTLREEGHSISPGSIGENVTVSGVPWDRVVPGARLLLGADVEIEITSYTAPCSNIADSFRDGRFVRVSQKVHPGWSRVYARVLREGELAAGDPVLLLPAPVPPR